MRYHVTGIDHAKGSHMTLDIDAPSKAAAEKRAQQAGMDVQHIQDASNHDEAHARATHRGEDDGTRFGWMVKVLVVLAIVVIGIAFAWPKIHAAIGR